MILPDKEYFFLDDAADILKCKERDLIHYGANGKLKISTRINTGDCYRIVSRSGKFEGRGYSDLGCCIFEQDLLALERCFDAGKIEISGFYLHSSEVAMMINFNQGFREIIDPDDLKEKLYFVRPTYYEVKSSELFISSNDLQQFINDNSNHLAESPSVGLTAPGSVNEKKGGKPKGALAEAVEYAYFKLLDQKDVGCLKIKMIHEFIERLKEMATENNRNADEFVIERIKEVKTPKNGLYTVTTQDVEKQYAQHAKKVESKVYEKNSVSKILTDLRKNYPIPA